MILSLLALLLILLAALLLAALTLAGRSRRARPTFRAIPAFQQLRRALDLSIEEGKQVHLSLGRGNFLTLQSAPGLATLGMLRRLAEQTAIADHPPLITSGEGTLLMLSQQTLQSAYRAARAEELYHPLTARLSGLSPFAYAAGTLPLVHDAPISAHLFLGNFGSEALLLTEAAERRNAFFIAATDDLTTQAGLFAATPYPLLGEELFSAGGYLGVSTSHQASLQTQDILRWLLIFALIALALLKFLGVL